MTCAGAAVHRSGAEGALSARAEAQASEAEQSELRAQERLPPMRHRTGVQAADARCRADHSKRGKATCSSSVKRKGNRRSELEKFEEKRRRAKMEATATRIAITRAHLREWTHSLAPLPHRPDPVPPVSSAAVLLPSRSSSPSARFPARSFPLPSIPAQLSRKWPVSIRQNCSGRVRVASDTAQLQLTSQPPAAFLRC